MNSELWYQLPPDMTMWNTAVLENVSRKIPELPSYVSAITWSKLDPATGDGEGLLELINGTAAAPIIIRGSKLAPIDIITTKSTSGEPKFYPLSSLFLQKIYADNVIGEPVENTAENEEDYEGPALKIKRFKTVDAVKYASVESAKYLIEEISKSASVASWMVENMPEEFVAIYERSLESVEKTAASPELPELSVVWKDSDTFYGNGEPISASKVSEFCKLAGVTDEEKSNMMLGVPIVRDSREKVAALVIPDHPVVTDDGIEVPEPNVSPKIALTSAVLRDGRVVSGLIFSGDSIFGLNDFDFGIYGDRRNEFSPPYDSPINRNPLIASTGPQNKAELFLSTEGYALARGGCKTTTRVPITLETIRLVSESSEPAVNMLCLVLNENSCIFGRIDEVVNLGALTRVSLYDMCRHESTVVRLERNTQIYEVVDTELQVQLPDEVDRTIVTTGVNGIVTRDAEGNLVVDGISHSIVNCPYALMSKYASSYDDAKEVCKIAAERGRCEFVAVFDTEKTAAINDNPDESKVKDKVKNKTKDTKNTQSGTDDVITDEDPMQISPYSPETLMSVDLENDPEMGFGSVPTSKTQITQMPITSRDLENVVQLNDPKVMDAYLLGNLATSNLTGQETLMQASDSILKALSHLSQLLFLVRQGSLKYLNESDIQVAMNKLTDVAHTLGIATIPTA